jgi:outer membrane protein assembly factor BamD
MHSRLIKLVAAWCAVLILGALAFVPAQQGGRPQSDATPAQRLEVTRQRLDAMRRSLNSAIAAMNAGDSGEKDKAKTAADDPRARLRGLEQEVSSLLSEVNNLRSKTDRSERVEASDLEKLESSATDLDTRVQAALQATASARSASAAAASSPKKKKKKGRLFGLLGGGDDDKYEDLTGTVAPGRDRELFNEATKEVRKGRYDTGRLLYNTIITTYPDSAYLPLAKLAIADSFYLEGTSSALIQAAQAYQDWLTFFPTDPLADDAMLKIAECEMRQMGLANRDVTHARKAEQRLKVLLQQFPNTSLRPHVEARIREVQENLGMHNLMVANFYYERNRNHKGGLKGAQSRYREILEKYPFFSQNAEVLYKLGATYMEEEEPDEAAKYFQQIARDYPNSDYAEKAREQLKVIGAPIPDPDPIKQTMPEPARPSLTARLLQEVVGSADVTVDKNGILISKDSKATDDLIDIAARNGGVLPATTPDSVIQRAQPTQRTAPPRQPAQQTAPAPKPAANTPQQGTGNSGVTAQPTQPGPPADASNSTLPASSNPTGTRP